MLPNLKSPVMPPPQNIFFDNLCRYPYASFFFYRYCSVGGDCVASCLCCRSGVAEGVSVPRTDRTRTYRRNVLSVFSMTLTVVTWALEVLERRRYPVTLVMERRIPEERNVHLFVCKVGCLSSQGQKLIAINFGYFVHWGFVHTSFKKPHGNRISPLTELHDRLCSTPNGRAHFGKATNCSGCQFILQ